MATKTDTKRPPSFMWRDREDDVEHVVPFNKATVGALKQFLGLKAGIWNHPDNRFHHQTYLVRMLDGHYSEDDYTIIEFTKHPVLYIFLASPYTSRKNIAPLPSHFPQDGATAHLFATWAEDEDKATAELLAKWAEEGGPPPTMSGDDETTKPAL